MTYFRAFLGLATALIFAYTAVVVSRHGLWFLPAYFDVVLGLTWSGQFALDFGIYLVLSALWVAWRHGFSASGIALGCGAVLLGAMVFVPYLLWLTMQSKGDVKQLVLGVQAHR